MTLPPPNCPSSENAALPGDLLTLLGQPAAAPAGGQPAAPFSDLLAGAAPATVTCTPPVSAAPATPAAPTVEPASQPAVNASSVMYSSQCYTTLLQPATQAEATANTDEPAGEIVSPDDKPTTKDEGALLLAYQLIAGQWVLQPINVPMQPANPQEILSESTDATVSGGGSPQTAGVTRRADGSIAQGRVTAQNGVFSTTTQSDKTVVAAAQDRLPKQPDATATENTAPTIPVTGVGAAKTPVATTIANTPKLEVPATPKSETTPTSTASEAARANLTDNTVLAASLGQPSRPADMPSVKFAAPGSEAPAETAPGGIPLSREQEKKTLVTDNKGIKSTGRQIGTSAAIRDYSMPYSAAIKTSEPSVTALPQSHQTGGMQSGTTAPVAEISSASSVQAPRLVQEIRAIADRISTIDRNTVEVRFDFNESDRLSVRVEYRDGTVHTTFRTDSESLRETIAREWQVQAVGDENRAYRVAEPVFGSNQATASTDLSQSGLGSGQSHARSFEQQAPSSFSGHAQPGRSASGASSTTSNTPVPTVRPETSLHLHTFA